MKHTKWIAIILLTTTLGSSIGLFFKTIGETENIKNTAYIFENNDRNIAETLSSMSGKSIDSILDTKAKFGDWNTVTKKLQAGEIHENVMSDEELDSFIKLKQFSQEEVAEAKALAGQTYFELQEILMNKIDIEKVNDPLFISEVKNISTNNFEAYEKLAQTYDKNSAIFFMLQLETEFETKQQVLDEYLYCLQVDIDFNICLEDKEKYNKLLLEKSVELMKEDAINSQTISQFLLHLLQVSHESQNEYINQRDDAEATTTNEIMSTDRLVDESMPAVSDPKPQDPITDIMHEIDSINSIWKN